jgi:hypothetical protein
MKEVLSRHIRCAKVAAEDTGRGQSLLKAISTLSNHISRNTHQRTNIARMRIGQAERSFKALQLGGF